MTLNFVSIVGPDWLISSITQAPSATGCETKSLLHVNEEARNPLTRSKNSNGETHKNRCGIGGFNAVTHF